MATTTTLLSRTVSNDAPVYSDPKFLTSLALHIPYLDTPNSIVLVAVDVQVAYSYTGDFYGLMKAYNVPPKYFTATMLLNDILDPMSFDGNIQQLKIPGDNYIDTLASRHNSISG